MNTRRLCSWVNQLFQHRAATGDGPGAPGYQLSAHLQGHAPAGFQQWQGGWIGDLQQQRLLRRDPSQALAQLQRQGGGLLSLKKLRISRQTLPRCTQQKAIDIVLPGADVVHKAR
jgi:hypothetical protein